MPDSFLRSLLVHPLTAGMQVDDPATTELRQRIISSKPFLRAIYDEWYTILAKELPPGNGDVLELGSGAGFCGQYIDGLITSEVFRCPTAQLVVDARHIPFPDDSLRAIVFTDVLHHMPDVRQFFFRSLTVPSARWQNPDDRAMGHGPVPVPELSLRLRLPHWGIRGTRGFE